MKNLQYGYPEICTKCSELEVKPIDLKVSPHFQPGNNDNAIRLMLIGQDPTIFDKPERVKEVLMLDDENGQLKRWLKGLFGAEKFSSITIYATNLVKCRFPKPPSTYKGNKFLKPYFNNCKEYLKEEILNYKPTIIMSLGEPSHKFFREILDQKDIIPFEMNVAFVGDFYRLSVEGWEFDYTPCLHIKTYRVAETYGININKFKDKVKEYF